MHTIIKNKEKKDYKSVESGTREAFWNIHAPGCDEHYLIHRMRTSPDFIPELAFVVELDGNIIGSIFFTKSYIIDELGNRHETLTFGPVSVLPELQGQRIGTALIEYAKEKAIKRGSGAILIYGDFNYYKRFGFLHAKEFKISNPEGKYPSSHLALELYEDALYGISGKAYESSVYHMLNTDDVEQYDALFEPKEKMVTESQRKHQKIVQTYL